MEFSIKLNIYINNKNNHGNGYFPICRTETVNYLKTKKIH